MGQNNPQGQRVVYTYEGPLLLFYSVVKYCVVFGLLLLTFTAVELLWPVETPDMCSIYAVRALQVYIIVPTL